jgi:hypothetical protein
MLLHLLVVPEIVRQVLKALRVNDAGESRRGCFPCLRPCATLAPRGYVQRCFQRCLFYGIDGFRLSHHRDAAQLLLTQQVPCVAAQESWLSARTGTNNAGLGDKSQCESVVVCVTIRLTSLTVPELAECLPGNAWELPLLLARVPS